MQMNGSIDQQDLGFLKATIEHQSQMIEELRQDMKDMKQNWSELKGGWRVLLIVSSLLGAIATQVASWIMKHV